MKKQNYITRYNKYEYDYQTGYYWDCKNKHFLSPFKAQNAFAIESQESKLEDFYELLWYYEGIFPEGFKPFIVRFIEVMEQVEKKLKKENNLQLEFEFVS